jgi:NADPH:quinone reductase-like Zn-dependent oxidoreductase
VKAIVQSGSGSADVLTLREIDRPTPTGDEVLVRVRSASVNAADWHLVHGGLAVRTVVFLQRAPTLPIRGVDLAGHVEAVGGNVTRFRPGDMVFGTGRGTFAEYATAREDRLAPKPAQLSFEEAAAIPVAAITALQGLRDTAHIQPGQRVLVYGAGGGVGTFAVQIARALGAHVTAATSSRNLDLVRSLGPDETIDHAMEDVTRRSRRYDVVFDVAAVRSLADLVRVVEPGGTLVLAGAAKSGMRSIVGRLAAAWVRSRLLGQRIVTYMARVSAEDLVVLKGLIEAGKVRPAIDREYPLTEVPVAVRYVGSGQARAKVVISIR